MKKYALLVGNDINNLVPNNSWRDLLQEIITFCNAGKLIKNFDNKPFPLLYEEIFLKAIQANRFKEGDLKKLIAKKVLQIDANEIHERIRKMTARHVLTTNYEFTLEGETPAKSNALVEEKLYSVFRHYVVGNKRYWHIHGDCRTPNSINLGFEHYGGQLQVIRNYVATGTNYANEKVPRLPLTRRLDKDFITEHSWIELFFTVDLYIFGLSLDFVETDLWWLLTYRARLKYYAGKNISNKIYYFIPKEYKEGSKEKIDLLQANGVIVVDSIPGKNRKYYYHKVLDSIEKK
ncbi:MAG: hypothetical protein QM731_16970 [Chitinophagaceae bacterium]